MKTAPAAERKTSVCPCNEICSIGKALGMIGGKWKLKIICSMMIDGTMRYNDLVRKVNGITNAMLASSLKELEADGIVTRKQYMEIPPRVEYALTEKGKALWPVLHRLAHWAKDEPFDQDEDVETHVREKYCQEQKKNREKQSSKDEKQE